MKLQRLWWALVLLLVPVSAWSEPSISVSGRIMGFDQDSITMQTPQRRYRLLKKKMQPLITEELTRSVNKKVTVEVPVAALIPRPTLSAHYSKPNKR